ncbi:MAG: hypothetical protein R2820_00515 [Cyclobacteriaceae bacterium]|nr:hypothetical protein [Cyclobacteriaceae bacterium]
MKASTKTQMLSSSVKPFPTWKAVLDFLQGLPAKHENEICISLTEPKRYEVKVTPQKSQKPQTKKSGIGVALYDFSW